MTQARLSTLSGGGMYNCQHEWPADCFVQCGTAGIVFTEEGSYRTAFFEAFPRNPDTFIRGEGESVETAEESAWSQWQKHLACPGHEFERRGYRNGAGFCKHCGLFAARAFEPTTLCLVCQKPTNYASDKDGDFYCEEHVDQIPPDKRSDFWDAVAQALADEVIEVVSDNTPEEKL